MLVAEALRREVAFDALPLGPREKGRKDKDAAASRWPSAKNYKAKLEGLEKLMPQGGAYERAVSPDPGEPL